jgi:hypothetical protein
MKKWSSKFRLIWFMYIKKRKSHFNLVWKGWEEIQIHIPLFDCSISRLSLNVPYILDTTITPKLTTKIPKVIIKQFSSCDMLYVIHVHWSASKLSSCIPLHLMVCLPEEDYFVNPTITPYLVRS